MVLFEWERESNQPVEYTEDNLIAWRGYEQLRDRFWAEIRNRPIIQSQQFQHILKARHTQLERIHGGYPFRTFNNTVDELSVGNGDVLVLTYHSLPQ
jgi:hypothetical protein